MFNLVLWQELISWHSSISKHWRTTENSGQVGRPKLEVPSFAHCDAAIGTGGALGTSSIAIALLCWSLKQPSGVVIQKSALGNLAKPTRKHLQKIASAIGHTASLVSDQKYRCSHSDVLHTKNVQNRKLSSTIEEPKA